MLHAWGCLDPRWRMVALVGTRGAHRDSLHLAHELAVELCEAGFVVVSGGAIGVDAAAHEGALAAGGCTVAVLGSGLQRLYPERNWDLFRRIARQGAVISPHDADVPPRRAHFPQRNRIVAALAEAVVVVEAPARSGALNTARHARALGLPVLAAPRGEGALGLLRRGAGLVQSGDDLVRVLQGKPARRMSVQGATPDEQEVLRLLVRRGGMALDEVAGLLGWRISRAAMVLLRLEVAGQVRSHAGGRFRRTSDDR